MPDIVVHARMGAEVIDKLKIKIDRDAFAFGLLGPDPYLFYRFFLPPFIHRVNRYSSVMHRVHTGAYLTELALRSRGNPELFAYLSGFLCHYALDSSTHPYINRKAKNDPAVHLAIEHRLDKLDGGELKVPPFLPERMKGAVGGAITKIYGWKDAWEKLKEGHSYMEPFYHMITHEGDMLNRILYHSHTKAALLTYQSAAVDELDLRGFYPLYRRAIDRATAYIRSVSDFHNGCIDEAALRQIIGNRSYIDG